MILTMRIETTGRVNNATAPYILTAVAKELERHCHGEYTVEYEVDHHIEMDQGRIDGKQEG